jgi:sugar phosphate isomerase/epimerase
MHNYMKAKILKNYTNCCIHTMTTKPWPLEEAVDKYSRVEIGGISVWRNALEGHNPKKAGAMIRNNGLEIVSLVRGGFFPHKNESDRQKAIKENLKIIDEAAAIGAPLIVLVCGAIPDQPLEKSRKQIQEALVKILPYAANCGVKLSIEPLHPMYAADRSAINTLAQANDMVEALASPYLGVTIDVYHLWWDPRLAEEIARCGRQGNIFSFHICDWKTPTEDMLNDRGLMGEGCINIRQIRGWVEAAGFAGFNEVEIFSTTYWQLDQNQFLQKILDAYLKYA